MSSSTAINYPSILATGKHLAKPSGLHLVAFSALKFRQEQGEELQHIQNIYMSSVQFTAPEQLNNLALF